MGIQTFAQVALSKLHPSVVNPRLELTGIEELAESIRANGIIEPLVVEQRDGDQLVILAGHRRAEAAKVAGLEAVPCIVRQGGTNARVVHLVENIQRVDLSPIETALSVLGALNGGLKGAELAKQLGRSAGWVSKFRTIAKAWEKIERKEDQPMMERFVQETNADALFVLAREVLGLVKKEEQAVLPIEDDSAEDSGDTAAADDEAEDEEVSETERAELDVIRELRELAEREHMGMAAGAVVSVEPHGKKGFRVCFTFANERAARSAFRRD